MSTIKLSFDVNRPLSEVWEFGIDCRRIPEWQFDIAAVKGINGPIQGVGYTYTLIYRLMGRNFASPVKITRFEPPHTLETSGRTPIGGFFKSMTLMQATNTATHVDWQMHYQLPLGFLGRIMDLILFRNAFEKTVRKYNENYKAVAEGRQPPHPTVSGKGNSG